MRKLKRINSLLLALIMVVVFSTSMITTVGAVESASTDTVYVIDDTLTIVQSEDGYFTFYVVPTSTYTGTKTYAFLVPIACNVKVMLGGRYTDGSSGILFAEVGNASSFQTRAFEMDGSVTAQDFGRWPVGWLTLTITPSNVSKQYVMAGEAYTLEY